MSDKVKRIKAVVTMEAALRLAIAEVERRDCTVANTILSAANFKPDDGHVPGEPHKQLYWLLERFRPENDDGTFSSCLAKLFCFLACQYDSNARWHGAEGIEWPIDFDRLATSGRSELEYELLQYGYELVDNPSASPLGREAALRLRGGDQ